MTMVTTIHSSPNGGTSLNGKPVLPNDDNVLVGTRVSEAHPSYEITYNMLTGIRFTVSGIEGKLDRPLTAADFEVKDKFAFDMLGTELTQPSKYDFKFKDYAPWIFRHIRNTLQVDPGDYLMSLTSKLIVSELSSPGKSKSFFYYSRDYKYIIKTVHHAEAKFLCRILPDYYQHIQDNPDTLLSHFYGLHRVKMPYGRKIHFVVMNNLMPPHKDIHGLFDLKGSVIGRDYPEQKLKEKLAAKETHPTLKDLNWLRRRNYLEFGPLKKQFFIDQLEKDVALLQRLNVMDYSLLVGMHDLDRGNKDNLRDQALKVYSPSADESGQQPGGLARSPTTLEHARRVRELRESVKKERPVPMQAATDHMPAEANRKGFFYKDDGGYRATNSDNTESSTVYYLGIIDCLTKYGTRKKLEHFLKGLKDDATRISAIPPQQYGERFLSFIRRLTKAADVARNERGEPMDWRESMEGIPGFRNKCSPEAIRMMRSSRPSMEATTTVRWSMEGRPSREGRPSAEGRI